MPNELTQRFYALQYEWRKNLLGVAVYLPWFMTMAIASHSPWVPPELRKRINEGADSYLEARGTARKLQDSIWAGLELLADEQLDDETLLACRDPTPISELPAYVATCMREFSDSQA